MSTVMRLERITRSDVHEWGANIPIVETPNGLMATFGPDPNPSCQNRRQAQFSCLMYAGPWSPDDTTPNHTVRALIVQANKLLAKSGAVDLAFTLPETTPVIRALRSQTRDEIVLLRIARLARRKAIEPFMAPDLLTSPVALATHIEEAIRIWTRDREPVPSYEETRYRYRGNGVVATPRGKIRDPDSAWSLTSPQWLEMHRRERPIPAARVGLALLQPI